MQARRIFLLTLWSCLKIVHREGRLYGSEDIFGSTQSLCVHPSSWHLPRLWVPYWDVPCPSRSQPLTLYLVQSGYEVSICWMSAFPSNSVWWTIFVSSSSFCRWTQWKQGLVTSQSWDLSLGLLASCPAFCGWVQTFPLRPLGRSFFFPHTLNQSVCSQSLIDLPLNFLRAGMSFILYLAQHERFLPSLVILNLQLNDKCWGN